MLPYNKKLLENAKEFRKNMTPEEKHLWYDFLKKLPFAVKRQKNIENYIVDFYIAKRKTVIEIDGLQHKTTQNRLADEERDKALGKWDIKVLRYSNEDVNKRFNIVCDDILKNLELTVKDLKNQ